MENKVCVILRHHDKDYSKPLDRTETTVEAVCSSYILASKHVENIIKDGDCWSFARRMIE